MQLCARAGRKAGEPPCWQNPQLDGNSAKGQMHTRTCQGHQKQLSIWHGAMLRAPLVSFWVWRCASGNFSSLVWTLEILKCIEMPKKWEYCFFGSSMCKCLWNIWKDSNTVASTRESYSNWGTLHWDHPESKFYNWLWPTWSTWDLGETSEDGQGVSRSLGSLSLWLQQIWHQNCY